MTENATTTSSSSGLFTRRTLVLLIALAAAVAASLLWGPPLAFHLLSPGTTGEAQRLADALRLKPGNSIAEIGAGSGMLAHAMVERVQPGGQMYATELDHERLAHLRDRVTKEGVVVIEAAPSSTNLPTHCCEAIYMRNVYHHIGNPAVFNRDLQRSLRPGGRVAVIDFEPGALPFLDEKPADTSPDRIGHGVAAAAVVRELRAAGFRIERVDSDWGGWMFLIVALAPQLSGI